MVIWIVMAIALVVIVAGGFVGRSRRDRNRQQELRKRHPSGDPSGQGRPPVTRARPRALTLSSVAG